jgi:hypothetical protein
MIRIISIVTIFVFLSSTSEANPLGTILKQLLKSSDEVVTVATSSKNALSTTAKKGDAIVPNSQTLKELEHIGSSNFILNDNFFIGTRVNLKNTNSSPELKKNSGKFFSWLSNTLEEPKVLMSLQSAARNINAEHKSTKNEVTRKPSNINSLPSVDSLHNLIAAELVNVDGGDDYITALTQYFFTLAAFGWRDFDPVSLIEYEKLNSIEWGEAAGLDVSIIAIGSSMDKRFEEVRTRLTADMSTIFSATEARYLHSQIFSCISLLIDIPGFSMTPWPVTESLHNKYCSYDDLARAVDNTILAYDVPPTSLISAGLKSTLLLMPTTSARQDKIKLQLRDSLMNRIPLFLETDPDSDAIPLLLSMLAYNEIALGNMRNSYDICLLVLDIAKDNAEIKNLIIGSIMPEIFLAADDIVTMKKLAFILEVMSQPKSDSFVLAETKINLLVVLSLFNEMVKRQSV